VVGARQRRGVVRVPREVSHHDRDDADEVHELGLREVARIRGEMERVKNEIGHSGDLQSFFDALRADPSLYFTDPAELIAGYQAIQQRVDAGMPLLFARRPKAGFEIRPVEAFRAASEAAGSYMPAAPTASAQACST